MKFFYEESRFDECNIFAEAGRRMKAESAYMKEEQLSIF